MTTSMESRVLHLAEGGGGSGPSAWWLLLLLLLLIPAGYAGWRYARRDRNGGRLTAGQVAAGADYARVSAHDEFGADDEYFETGTTGTAGSAEGAYGVVPAAAPTPRRHPIGDGVGSYLNAEGERVPVPIGGHLPLSSDAQQAPDGYPIKGDADTGLYHLPTDPWFHDVIAAVWLASEPAARAAGFRRGAGVGGDDL
ncbi:MAG: hypothetical protein QM809_00645 [Gordonia sp. (in: high G+C Gram-positive bacteria)]|uniref:sunset domain-containing protein n=1 Tax=Gordonia sp. (in: high G+C Gram-positive bacteria) TaxID=84139 RepID=UPI0039E3CA3D